MIEHIMVVLPLLASAIVGAVIGYMYRSPAISYMFHVDIMSTEYKFKYDGQFPDRIRTGQQLEIYGVVVMVHGVKTVLTAKGVNVSVYCEAIDKKNSKFNKPEEGDEDGDEE